MKKLIVVYDACVLYPAPLRDLLMWLALTDLFQAKWTEKIHQEWIENVLKNRPDLTLNQLNTTKELMNLEEYLKYLENQGLIETVAVLKECIL